MHNLFNPKRNRAIAGVIVALLVVAMLLTAVASFIG